MKRTLALMMWMSISGLTMAGNVTARISGGSLYVYGDNTDNAVVIESSQAGQISVTGLTTGSGVSTSVNGQPNGTVNLNGWTRGVYVYMYNGQDSVQLPQANIQGALTVDMGEGNDELYIGGSRVAESLLPFLDLLPEALVGSVHVASTLYITTLNGNDLVSVTNATVRSAATIDLGVGNDDLYVGGMVESPYSAAFDSNLVVLPGSDQDLVQFTSVSVLLDLIIDDATSPLDLDLFGVYVGRNAFIYGTPSDDNIAIGSMIVSNLLKIISEDGHDRISLTDVDATILETYGHGGNDQIGIFSSFADRLVCYLDAGMDSLEIAGGQIPIIYAFGGSNDDLFRFSGMSSNEAYLYGDGGVDTFQNTGNSIGKLRTYSIENQ